MRRIWFVVVSLLLFEFACAQTSTSWPNYRGNPVLNGVSNSHFKPPVKMGWSFNAGDEIKSSPIIAENMIFVGSMNGFLYALDLNGKLQWKFKTDASIEAPPAFVRKTVVVGSMDGTVYALDYKTGKLKWKYKTEGQIAGGANWMTDGTGVFVLVPSYDYNLYCIHLETGKLRWTSQTDNYLNGTPATDNRRIVIGGCDSYVHILDTTTGKNTAKVGIGTYVAESTAISSNLAFVGDYDGGFTCVDLLTNKVKWKFNNPRAVPFLSSPAVSGNRVIIGSTDKKLYCFHKETGEILWSYQTFGRIESSAVIVRNRAVICSNDGVIHFVSIEDGKKIATYELGVAMKSTPAFIDNLMVVGGKDGKIYGLKGSL